MRRAVVSFIVEGSGDPRVGRIAGVLGRVTREAWF